SPTPKNLHSPQTHHKPSPHRLPLHTPRCLAVRAPTDRDCRIDTPCAPLSLKRNLSYRSHRLADYFSSLCYFVALDELRHSLISVLDSDVLSFYVAKLAQSQPNGLRTR